MPYSKYCCYYQVCCRSFRWVIFQQKGICKCPTLNHYLEHRAAIRESWATVAQNETKIVFLLGRPLDSESSDTMVKISDEAAKYSDILLGNYTDTYANLTLKECWIKDFD